MNASPQEITIETPTLRLAARAWGPEDGLPVLALHGWLDNAATYDGLAPLLPGLRLVCLDLPGHGLSEHLPPGSSYAFLDTVAHVHAAITALGWERPCLLGHSLGAALSSILAGTIPARIRALVLLEGLGPLTEAANLAPQRLAHAIDQEQRKHGRAAPVYASEDEAVRRLVASLSKLTPASARILCARGLRAVEGGVTWRSDPRLRLPSRLRLTEEQVLAFLQAIECPTLLVRGDEGFPFAPQPMSARVAALRHGELVEVPGGHHLHLDTPQLVAPVLQRFFASVRDAETQREPSSAS